MDGWMDEWVNEFYFLIIMRIFFFFFAREELGGSGFEVDKVSDL